MAITYLKQANPPTQAIDTSTAGTVRGMLDTLQQQGEEAARAYARELDAWGGDIVVGPQTFARAEAALSEGVKQDIRFARDRAMRQPAPGATTPRSCWSTAAKRLCR